MASADALRRWIHWLFEGSLLIKGLLAGAETLSGLALLLTSNARIIGMVDWLISNELTQDPDDAMAQFFHHAVASLSIQSQHFYALYLLAHGALKLAMVFGLARRILWSYPAAMVILSGFVGYQMSHYFLGPSPVLLALSALDAFMIWLVWREYKALIGREPLS